MYNDTYYINGRRTFLNSVTVLDPAGAEVALLEFDMQDLGHGPRACQASQKRAAARPVRVLYEPFRWGSGGAWKYSRLKTGSHLAPWQSPERHAQSQREGRGSIALASRAARNAGSWRGHRVFPATCFPGTPAIRRLCACQCPFACREPPPSDHRPQRRSPAAAVRSPEMLRRPDSSSAVASRAHPGLRAARSKHPACRIESESFGVRRSGFFLDR